MNGASSGDHQAASAASATVKRRVKSTATAPIDAERRLSALGLLKDFYKSAKQRRPSPAPPPPPSGPAAAAAAAAAAATVWYSTSPASVASPAPVHFGVGQCLASTIEESAYADCQTARPFYDDANDLATPTTTTPATPFHFTRSVSAGRRKRARGFKWNRTTPPTPPETTPPPPAFVVATPATAVVGPQDAVVDVLDGNR